jgi:hypothetical protein
MSGVQRSSSYTGVGQVAARREQQQQQELFSEQAQEQQLEAQQANAKRKRTIIIIVVIVTIVAFIGIGVLVYFLFFRAKTTGNNTNTGTGTGTGGTGSPLGGGCTSSSDCSNGLICSADFCKNPPESSCTSSTTCPNGYVCANGSCKGLVSAQCSKDQDCSGQFACVNQSCATIACTTVGDCPNLTATNREDCVALKCVGGHGDACTDVTQCNSFMKCVNNTCGGLLGDKCGSTADCLTPYICTAGVCAAQACTTASDCTNAQIGLEGGSIRCDTNVCADGAGFQCLEQAQCGDPNVATCNPSGPSSGLCVGFGGVPCGNAFDTLSCFPGLPCVVDNVRGGFACGCVASSNCISIVPNCVGELLPSPHNICSA